MLEICMSGWQTRRGMNLMCGKKEDYKQKMVFVAKKNYGKYYSYANMLNICQVLCSLEYYAFLGKVNSKVNYYL